MMSDNQILVLSLLFAGGALPGDPDPPIGEKRRKEPRSPVSGAQKLKWG